MKRKRFVDDGFGPCVRCKATPVRLNADNLCRKCFGQGAG